MSKPMNPRDYAVKMDTALQYRRLEGKAAQTATAKGLAAAGLCLMLSGLAVYLSYGGFDFEAGLHTATLLAVLGAVTAAASLLRLWWLGRNRE